METNAKWGYDVAVLGGGPGGYVAAIRCAQNGLKTALIEARELGGTCLNRGCVPTKALLHGARQYAEAVAAIRGGILSGAVECDFSAIAKAKDSVVSKLRAGVAALERANGVTVIQGHGTLKDAHTIQVNNALITAEKLIIATGSAPAKPPIPGADGERVLTSDGVLALSALPKDIVIIGGGVIGIEFAQLFSSLGCAVTVLELMEDILPGISRNAASAIKRRLEAGGVSIMTSVRVKSITSGAQDATVSFAKGEQELEAHGEYCVMCTGRRPCTAGLGLEALGVDMERSYIKTDGHMRTSVENIYAVGDITGKNQLAHVASAQGLTAADSCANKAREMRYDRVPACIYTAPEIATVGLSVDKAKEKGLNIKTGRFQLAGNGKALIEGDTDGHIELVTDAVTGELLGAEIYASRATDMISEITAVMSAEGTVDELVGAIHPHPTLSEGVFEAAMDVFGASCHKIPNKKER